MSVDEVARRHAATAAAAVRHLSGRMLTLEKEIRVLRQVFVGAEPEPAESD